MRLQDWPQRLAAHFDAHKDTPFKWGTHDCVLFAAGSVNAMRGGNMAGAYRGAYTTKGQAAKHLKALGVVDVSGLATKALGEPYTSPAFAKRGDVVSLATDLGLALGVVDLSGKYALAASKDGLVRIPFLRWLQAWEV
jgi:hypothetical protein